MPDNYVVVTDINYKVVLGVSWLRQILVADIISFVKCFVEDVLASSARHMLMWQMLCNGITYLLLFSNVTFKEFKI